MSIGRIAINFILFQVALSVSVANAKPAEQVYSERFVPRIAAVKAGIETQNLLQSQQPVTNACLRRYDQLYSNQTLTITLALGYYDNRPGGDAVQDPTMDAEISKMLVAPCVPNQTVCGFKRVSADPGDTVSKVFTKTIVGPDQKPKIIKINMFHATDNIDDDVNRVSDSQLKRSEVVAKEFKYSLRTSDVVFYLGHSRDGGGPDFDPPRLLPNLHVDYNWYHQNRGDFRDYLAEIKNRSTPAKLLALLSCSSALHFSRAVSQTSPQSGLLVTLNLIGDGQMFEGLITFLNGIQRFKCESQLSSDLNAVNIDKKKIGTQERSLLQFRRFPPQ